MKRNEALRRANPVQNRAGDCKRQFALERLVLDLDRTRRVNEVARRHPAAGPHDASERGQRILGGALPDIQLVEEAGRIHEVETIRLERRLEDVSRDEIRRGVEVHLPECRLRRREPFEVGFEGGEASFDPDALAQTFEPKRGCAAGVENVEPAYLCEEIQLPIAESDEVGLEFLALFRRQGVLSV